MKKLTVIATAIATTLSASAFAAPYGDSPSVAFTGTKRFDISYHDQNNGRMIHDTIDLTATQAANFAHAVSRGEGAYKDGTIALHRSSAPQMKTPVAQPHYGATPTASACNCACAYDESAGCSTTYGATPSASTV